MLLGKANITKHVKNKQFFGFSVILLFGILNSVCMGKERNRYRGYSLRMLSGLRWRSLYQRRYLQQFARFQFLLAALRLLCWLKQSVQHMPLAVRSACFFHCIFGRRIPRIVWRFGPITTIPAFHPYFAS